MEQIDGYCERIDFSFWAEPVNALTNAAFVIAAVALWPRTKNEPLARALCVILALIGLGSFLFHTFATQWAALADVLPIVAYILLYIFAINRAILRWPLWAALWGTAAFIPFAALTAPLFQRLPGFDVSAFYWPVPTLILIYAAAIRGSLGRDLAIGAGLLILSLIARSADMAVCDGFPLGTHFLWHIFNGIMLGWMIHAYLKARRLAAAGAER